MKRASASLLCLLVCVLPAAAQDKDKPSPSRDFLGRLEPAEDVEIKVRTSGLLEKVLIRPGDRVKKGDLLFEIESTLHKAELKKAEAQRGIAESALKRWDKEHARALALRAARTISEEEFDRIAGNYAGAVADLKLADTVVELARTQLDYTQVRSPIDGVVARLDLSLGNLVKAYDTALAQIVATDPIRLAFNVPEASLLRLHKEKIGKDLEVEVGLAGEEGFSRRAKVVFIAATVDPATHTIRFHAILPNPDGALRPGQSARVRLVGATSP